MLAVLLWAVFAVQLSAVRRLSGPAAGLVRPPCISILINTARPQCRGLFSRRRNRSRGSWEWEKSGRHGGEGEYHQHHQPTLSPPMDIASASSSAADRRMSTSL